MSEFVTIVCTTPHGIVLRDDRLGGTTFTAKGMRSPGCPLSLWQAWSRNHKDQPILQYVHALDDKGKQVPAGE